MPRRNRYAFASYKRWLAAVFVAFGAISGGAFSQSLTKPEAAAKSTEAKENKIKPAPGDDAAPPPAPRGKASENKLPTAENYIYSCDKPSQREDADSCQQRRSADAAENTLRLTKQQIILTWIGLIISFLGAIFTGWAAYAAAIAGRAAQQSVEASQRNTQLQLRAYLLVSEAVIVTEAAVPFRIDITVQNYGSTPAHNVAVSRIAVCCDPRLIAEQPLAEDSTTKTFLGSGSGLRASAVLREKWVPTYEARSLERDFGLAIFAYGEIRYEDIFGNKQRTTFRHVVVPSSSGDRVVPHESGNEAT